MKIRPEVPADAPAVRAVNQAAFETDAEADLVGLLHAQASPLVALVAEEAGSIVGHILFSPVKLAGHPGVKIMGLAPMAVLPEYQRRGIGSALVRTGLDICKRLGAGAVVVLGHAHFYPRFGFQAASRWGLGCEYEVPDDAFMAVELEPGFLSGKSGTIEYHGAFRSA